MAHPAYERTQTLWLLWVLLPATALATGMVAWFEAGSSPAGVATVAVVIVAEAALLLCFGRFTVAVGDGRIVWRFGIFGRPRWQLPLADVARVEVARSTWLEGWGVRRTREGMLYNASGSGAVRLHLKDGRRIRLGSDEPERLAAFIAARL